MSLDLNDPETLSRVLAVLPKEKVGFGMVASATCLVAWEYLCTMPLSFQYIASRRSRTAKAFFLANRYLGVFTAVAFVVLGSGGATHANCSFLSWSVSFSWAAMSLNSIFVLLRRTWCISNKSALTLYLILPFALFMAGSVIAIVAQTHPVWVPAVDLCMISAVSAVNPLRLRILMSASALYDCVIMVLTVHRLRMLSNQTGITTPFLAMLEAHSIFYYMLIAIFDLSVLISSFVAPTLITSLASFIPAILTITVQRVLLEDVDFSTRIRMTHYREFVKRNTEPQESLNLSPQSMDNGLASPKSFRRSSKGALTSNFKMIIPTFGGNLEASNSQKGTERQSGWKAYRKNFLSHRNARMMGIHESPEAGLATEILVEEEYDVQVDASTPPEKYLSRFNNHPYARQQCFEEERERASKSSTTSTPITTDDFQETGEKVYPMAL